MLRSDWGDWLLRCGAILVFVLAGWGIASCLEHEIPVGMPILESVYDFRHTRFSYVVINVNGYGLRWRLFWGMLALETIYALAWHRLCKFKRSAEHWALALGVGLVSGVIFLLLLRS